VRSGRCLCGAVRFQVAGAVRDILVCHCVECRRWTGGPWPATVAQATELEIDGAEHLRWRHSPASEKGAERGFCTVCGSALFWRVPGGSRIGFGAGTLDDASGLEVAGHIWVEHAQAWSAIPDGLPQHPRGYPVDGPAIPWR